MGTEKRTWTALRSGDSLITTIPGRVWSVILDSDSGGASTVVLRDGDNTTGDAFLSLTSPADDSRSIIFVNPVCFKKGLFVDVGANVNNVMVQYE